MDMLKRIEGSIFMKAKLLWVIAITFNLIIWIHSLLPGDVSSSESSIFAYTLDQVLKLFHIDLEYQLVHLITRKIAHFTFFFILSLLWIHIYKNHFSKIYLYMMTWIHTLMSAFIDEGIQYFTPGRVASITDVIIDFSGAVLASLLFLLVRNSLNHKKIEVKQHELV